MKKIITFCLVLLLSSSVCHAEKNEWKDKKYDFKSIKKVGIIISYATTIQDKFAQQKTEEIITQIGEKKKFNVIFYDLNLLILQIIKENDLEKITDEKGRLDAAFKKLPQYVDAVMFIKVNELGWFKQYVPPSTYTYTTHKTSSFQAHQTFGTGGVTGTVTTPVEHTVTEDGHYEEFPVASAEFTLCSTTTGRPIWGYSELINEQGGEFFSRENKPEDNLEDIFNHAANNFPVPKQ